jgi:hypothetical protein
MSEQVNKQEIKTDLKTETKFDIRHWIVIYIHEFLEVFISILIIRIAMDKEVDMYRIIQASAAIGLITFILENYNSDFKSNIKQGITFSVGSQMMSSFMN